MGKQMAGHRYESEYVVENNTRIVSKAPSYNTCVFNYLLSAIRNKKSSLLLQALPESLHYRIKEVSHD